VGEAIGIMRDVSPAGAIVTHMTEEAEASPRGRAGKCIVQSDQQHNLLICAFNALSRPW
jgi:hypothetical protein